MLNKVSGQTWTKTSYAIAPDGILKFPFIIPSETSSLLIFNICESFILTKNFWIKVRLLSP